MSLGQLPPSVATETRFRGCDLQVLMLLVCYADTDGWCRRTQGSIAGELGRHRVTIIESLNRLARLGYLERRAGKRPDGGKAASAYRVKSPRKARATWAANGAIKAVVTAVAAELGVDRAIIVAEPRGDSRTVLARQVAEYLAVTALNWSATRVAPFFQRHRSTVDHTLREIEDRRDDPAFDAILTRLTDRIAPVAVG
jgi:predicted transcriptional regulator